MAASKTVIANLALSHLGISKQIANLDTDRSVEAAAMRQFYDEVRDQVLDDFPWSFARAFAKPGLVQRNPTREWGFSYRLPSDCLTVKRILSGRRTDTRQSRIPFIIVSDDAGLLIYTDYDGSQNPDANPPADIAMEIEYIRVQDDPTKYSADFTNAFALKLAFFTAPQITAGDPFKIRQSVAAMYEKQVTEAEVSIANEEQPDEEPDSQFVRIRGGGSECDTDGRFPWRR